MPFIEQLSANLSTIVITSIMVLASIAMLYSIGAFSRVPPPKRKQVNNKAGNGGEISQPKTN
jgi:hypothetical protein